MATPKKVGAIEPGQALLSKQADVGFVDESCRLQRVTLALGPQIVSGEFSKLFVHVRNKVVSCLRVSVPPCVEQLADRTGVCLVHSTPPACAGRLPDEEFGDVRQIIRSSRIDEAVSSAFTR